MFAACSAITSISSSVDTEVDTFYIPHELVSMQFPKYNIDQVDTSETVIAQ